MKPAGVHFVLTIPQNYIAPLLPCMLHFSTEADFHKGVTSLTCSDLQKSSGFRIISCLSQRFAPINFAACCASAAEYIKSVFIKIEIVHGTHVKMR